MNEMCIRDRAYNYATEVNGHPAAMAMVYQTAGSNAAEMCIRDSIGYAYGSYLGKGSLGT